MSQVVGRLKRKSVEICKIMAKDGDIVTLPNLANSAPFDPHYKREDDQWLVIDDFSATEYSIESLGGAVNTAEFPQLKKDQAGDLKFICIIQGAYRFYQKISSSQIVRKKWMKVSDDFDIVENEKIILINELPDAIHDTANDKLYFINFVNLKVFFSKVEELYREATDAEVKAFLQNEVIRAIPEFTSEKVSKPNRKRIALAQEKLGAYTKQNVEQLLQEFPEYVKDVEIKNGAFSITNDNDLKMAIFCIEERFYTTAISKERRLANSVMKLGVGN